MNDAERFMRIKSLEGMVSLCGDMTTELRKDKDVNREVTLKAIRNFLETVDRSAMSIVDDIDAELYTPIRTADDDIPF